MSVRVDAGGAATAGGKVRRTARAAAPYSAFGGSGIVA